MATREKVNKPNRWIPVTEQLPTARDADSFHRVWAIALDAVNRSYPCETYYKHVRAFKGDTYTHWARPITKKVEHL